MCGSVGNFPVMAGGLTDQEVCCVWQGESGQGQQCCHLCSCMATQELDMGQSSLQHRVHTLRHAEHDTLCFTRYKKLTKHRASQTHCFEQHQHSHRLLARHQQTEAEQQTWCAVISTQGGAATAGGSAPHPCQPVICFRRGHCRTKQQVYPGTTLCSTQMLRTGETRPQH